MDTLTAVFDVHPHTKRLFGRSLELADGTVIAQRSFESPRVGGAGVAAARMVRLIPGFDFDIGELPVVNFLSAWSLGVPITAIPVFPTRRFLHERFLGDAAQGVHEPADFEGRRVGCSYYGHTDVTWARGIIADDFGVQLDKVTWVTSAQEQVAGAPVPGNVLHLPRADLDLMLTEGELAGQILTHNQPGGRGESITSLFADPAVAAAEWFGRTGIFPILHTVAVKNSVLDAHPDLAKYLYDVFDESKAQALEDLNAGIELSDAEKLVAWKSGFPVAPTSADPLVYGLEPNRHNLETLVRYCVEQSILDEPIPLDQAFASV